MTPGFFGSTSVRGLSQTVAALSRLRQFAVVYDYVYGSQTPIALADEAAVPLSYVEAWLADSSALAAVTDARLQVLDARRGLRERPEALRGWTLATLWEQLGGDAGDDPAAWDV